MAVAVEVAEMRMPVAMPVEVDMPVRVDVNVTAQMDMPADMRQVPTVTVDMTDHAGMTNHTRVAATDDAVGTSAAAAMRTRIGRAGDERREADNGRGDESEECGAFEHGSKTFGLDVGHPTHSSGEPSRRFKRLIFAGFSFI